MKAAWWVHYGLGLATGLAAFALYWTHAEMVKQSEEVRISAAVAKAGADVINASAMADEDLVNALAQYLDLEPLEKQALLERNCLRSRAESLVELLEMKILMSRTPRTSTVAH